MISHILLGVLCVLAIAQDMRTRKIKNMFNLLGAVVSLAVVLITGDVGLADALLGLLSAFLLGILLWKLGAIRAGDAKFMWIIGIVKGLKAFWVTMNCAVLAGGVIALGITLVKRDFKRRFVRLWLHIKGIFLTRSYSTYEAEHPEEFPFTIPLAIGCTVEYLMRGSGK